jgi:hypothetical protein
VSVSPRKFHFILSPGKYLSVCLVIMNNVREALWHTNREPIQFIIPEQTTIREIDIQRERDIGKSIKQTYYSNCVDIYMNIHYLLLHIKIILKIILFKILHIHTQEE